MAKVNVEELLSLPDPFLSDNYELIIPNVPGGGDGRILRINCQSAPLPGANIEAVMQEASGNQLMHAGRTIYTHEWNVTVIEDRMLRVHKAMRDWKEYARNHRQQLGHYKSEYARNCELVLFDQKGIEIERFTMYNAWASTVPDINLAGNASELITHAFVLTYDYWEPKDKFSGSQV